ncbi:riboflavin kinase [Candidatus Phytoplasma solani]|uniref:riboflavin biosynthesis protein RibF n=1 Tax=Candidatus Phytoplasma solani TaxID=69896 RepID=UPI0032DA5D54
MKIINSLLIRNFNTIDSLTLSFGDFDGLHLGHQYILQKLISFKDTKNALINFLPNSKAFFQQKEEFFLTSLDQKIAFYRFLGLNYLFLWRWSQKLALLTKNDFINVLKQNHVKRIVITKEARFGYQRKGNYQDLSEIFEVCVIEDYAKNNNCQHKISSTYIKKLLIQGKIEEANFCLGKPYLIQGKVIEGQQKGRLLGFRTANLDYTNFFLPHPGVYAVFVIYESKKYAGTANLGVRPTFEKETKKLLEIHILNFDKVLYNQIIEVEFISFLRKEKKFTHISELIAQIQKDVAVTKDLLNKKTF